MTTTPEEPLPRYPPPGSDGASGPVPGVTWQIPAVVTELAGDADVEPVWRNQMGGLTFRAAGRYIKWNPASTGLDLAREHRNLRWLTGRHRVPRVVDFGDDGRAQWLVTDALEGTSAVADAWITRPEVAVPAIAAGLRALHALAWDEFPASWSAESWVTRAPRSWGERPPVDAPVLVHGDACAPNTVISADGAWVGNVDFGALAVGDRWADLAVASMSLEWNYGPGFDELLYSSYGIAPDPARIAWYRRLWHTEA